MPVPPSPKRHRIAIVVNLEALCENGSEFDRATAIDKLAEYLDAYKDRAVEYVEQFQENFEGTMNLWVSPPDEEEES